MATFSFSSGGQTPSLPTLRQGTDDLLVHPIRLTRLDLASHQILQSAILLKIEKVAQWRPFLLVAGARLELTTFGL